VTTQGKAGLAPTMSLQLRVVGGCLLAMALAGHVWEIRHRGIDPDELVNHLHNAFSIWSGEVIYRDFFAYHGPALSYLLQPLFWLLGPDFSVLWWGRALNSVFAIATLFLTGCLGRRLCGAGAGWVAAALLAWTTIFHVKAIELRPDVPAMLLVALATWVLVSASGSLTVSRCLVSGSLAGLAMLFTQKAIVPAAGLGLAVLVVAGTIRLRRGVALAGAVVAGALVPWGAATAWFVWHNAAGDFLRSTLYQLAVIPVRSSRWEHLRPTLSADLSVWVLAAWELVETWQSRREREVWSSGRGLIAILTAWCLFSLVWVKAAYPQFYLLWMPFVAVLAAKRLATWGQTQSRLTRFQFWMWLAVVASQLLLIKRALSLGQSGPTPHLDLDSRPLTTTWFLVVTLSAAAIAIAISSAFERRGWFPRQVFVLAMLGMGYGAFRNLDALAWFNESQLTAIRSVEAAFPPNGRVLDGFTGLAPLRRHAYYFCWINEYSGALMSPEDREQRLLRVLRETPPAAVLFDEHLQRLPSSVTVWIREHYHPSDVPPLWLPNDAESIKSLIRP